MCYGYNQQLKILNSRRRWLRAEHERDKHGHPHSRRIVCGAYAARQIRDGLGHQTPPDNENECSTVIRHRVRAAKKSLPDPASTGTQCIRLAKRALSPSYYITFSYIISFIIPYNQKALSFFLLPPHARPLGPDGIELKRNGCE